MSRKFLALQAVALVLAAQAAVAATRQQESVAAKLSYDVHYLASGALEGRFSGSEGATVAAAFIADRFRDLGLKPSGDGGTPYEHFSFIARVHPGPGNALSFDVQGGPRIAKVEEEFRPLAFSSSGSASGEVVFAGYGIHAPDLAYDVYAGLDVKGKVVLVLRYSPDGDDPASRFQPHMALRRKASEARALGAAAVLVATGPVGAKETAPVKISFDASFADSGLPVLGISTPLAEALFAGHGFNLAELQQRMNERKEPASRPLGVRADLAAAVVQERADAVNVLALLPGADPALAGEVVVVGAHYDHLGYGGDGSGSLAIGVRAIHPGADDNASGTAGMLEIARRLASHPPARSVLFAAFAGEEEGLLGSKFFVEHLPASLTRCVGVFNLDMEGVGRGAYVAGGKNHPDLFKLLEQARDALEPGITLKAGLSEGEVRADHGPFQAAGIPAVSLFGNGASPHHGYHTDEDTIWWIAPKNMEAVGRIVLDAAVRAADSR